MIRTHVELDRRFRRLAPAAGAEQTALDSYAAELLGQPTGLAWTDLLAVPRVVVLGEPGSGKTHEFRTRAASLRSEGQLAFFVPLDRLVMEPLEEALPSSDRSKLKGWLRGDSWAWFFLDSVDEAKHRSAQDFLGALDRFAAGTAQAIDRARVVLSSRITDWRPDTDRAAVETRLSPGDSDTRGDDAGESRGHPLVVQIDPLDRDRVQRLATTQVGTEGGERFVRALDDSHAWAFARRPLDVNDLLGYWQERGSLGTLTDLLEFDLDHKLQETDERQRQDQLSPALAREGAMALAAATAFCRRFEFRVAREQRLDRTQEAMDPGECLPATWPPAQQEAILSRALFDGASLGRIRFHHRRVAEYLAAQWLHERMTKGCPIETLEELLFDIGGDPIVMRPTLAPESAWLASGETPWASMVRANIVKADPTLFLRYGDPSRLPLAYRQQLLRALARCYSGRRDAWIQSEPDALARLGDPGLAELVSELIRDKAVSGEVRELLLMLVRFGRLAACMDLVISILADPAESTRLKLYAAAAVRDAGDLNSKRRLASVVAGFPTISSVLCGAVCEAVYPVGACVQDLIALLAKVEHVSRKAAGDLPWRLEQLFERTLPLEDQRPWLEGLLQLSQTGTRLPDNNRESPISKQFYWAADVALTVAGHVLRRDQLDAKLADVVSEALATLWAHRRLFDESESDRTPITDGVRRHDSVRRGFTCRRIQASFRTDPSVVPHAWEILDFDAPFHLGKADLTWLCDEIHQQEVPGHRRAALALAAGIWEDLGRPRNWKRAIRQAAATETQLREEAKRLTRLQATLRLRRLWYRRLRHSVVNRWWWRDRWTRATQQVAHVRDWWSLQRNCRRLAAGHEAWWLYHLACSAAAGDRWAADRWDSLEQRYGRRIARAAREGCKSAWRLFSPGLPHEKPDPRQTDIRICVGLTGLAAASADGELSLQATTADDAALATRYAVNELNAFPEWIHELANSHPVPVGRVLCECVTGEWTLLPFEGPFHGAIAHLRWHGHGLVRLVAETVVARLQAGDPTRPELLEDAISLLQQSLPNYHPLLARLAAERVPGYAPEDQRHTRWVSVWLQTDAHRAIDYLEHQLETMPNPTDVIVRVLVTWQDRPVRAHTASPQATTLDVPSMARFIPLVYRYLRPEEDVVLEPGLAYTPAAREDAQHVRDALLSRLAVADDCGAEVALRSLADSPLLVQRRDWILHLLEERRARLADLRPWAPSEVRTFALNHETDPQSDLELFTMARRRLSDIRFSVERADISARSDVVGAPDEGGLRSWLARQLRAQSRGRYTVPQEVEIDLRQRPDLRIERPGVAVIPIEVKWAEKWSGPQLFERLETQLVGQYMRDHETHYGFYLLGYRGNPKGWDLPATGTRVDFLALIQALNERAQQIINARPEVRGLKVIGIDFREPVPVSTRC